MVLANPTRLAVHILLCATLISSLVGFAVGRSHSKAASKENFQKVLTAFFDNNCGVLTAGVRKFPAEIDSNGLGQPSPFGMVPAAQIDALRQPNASVGSE